ncbi:MAG: FAD-binding oxidoreductase [Fimbriimonadales bacterium]
MTEEELALRLVDVLSPGQVMSGEAVERAYDCDAYTVHRAHPQAVVFPKTSAEVQKIVRWCIENGVPYTPRGAGTGLSGGSMPAHGGVIVALTRMREILQVDIENRTMLAQAGCPNLALSKAVEAHCLHFAPDPSSQTVCTLGGNINENSGGPHTLKYGVTADHVLAVTLVDCEGEIRTFGGVVGGSPGLDLLGFVIGSEGTLGIVTEALVRLTPNPINIRTMLAAFANSDQATNTVSLIIASGIIPAAMEFMDATILQAVEAAFHTGLPTDAGALLLIECDGDNAESEIASAEEIARAQKAVQIRIAEDADHRAKLWIARKKSIGAIGRISLSMVTHDGVIPRSKLPEVLDFVYKTAEQYGLRVANIFHAGDGNLHPIFLFDDRNPEEVDAVVAAGEAVIRKCLAEGGSVTGEHGIGVEKIDLLAEMFAPEDLRMQEDLRRAFNDGNLCNPGKVLPSQKSCVEVKVRRRAAH